MDTVATFVQPNSAPGGQDATNYKGAIDASAKVMSQIAAAFAPHAAATPNMTVIIDAGSFQTGVTRVSQAQQTTAAITAPTTQPRNDLTVIDQTTGAKSVVTGAEAASPADPAIPSGKIAVARVRLTVGMTSITNADIDDLRPAYLIASSLPDVAGHEGHVLAVASGVPAWVAQVLTDLTARNQIALTNLRLLKETSLTSGAIAQGRLWGFESDEWGSSSTGETWNAAGYYTNHALVAVSQSAGTPIGNMTAYGGLAAAFDGNADQPNTSCAYTPSVVAAGYIGKHWGSGITKRIASAVVDSANLSGFSDSYNSGTNTLTLEGSNDNFTTIATLGSKVTVTEGLTRITDTVTATDTSVGYEYVRIKITNSNGGDQLYVCAEVVFTEVIDSDMILIPPAVVPVVSAPVWVDVFVLYKDDSGTAVLGTDFTGELSADSGAHYAFGTITAVAAYSSDYTLLRIRADVSANPGTNLLCRLSGINGKTQRAAAALLCSE